MVPILSQMHPVHTFPSYFHTIHSNISYHLRLGLTSGIFPSRFPTKILYAFFISHTAILIQAPSSALMFKFRNKFINFTWDLHQPQGAECLWNLSSYSLRQYVSCKRFITAL